MAMKIASFSSSSWRRLHHVFRSGEALLLTASAYVFFLFPTGSHITKEDGMGWGKFSYAKWGTNEFKSGKYSNHSSQRLEISIFLITRRRVSFCCLSTPLRRWQKWKHTTIALFVYDTFYDTFYNAIRVFSFHSCWLDQKFIIQRTHSCFTTF